MAPSFDMTRTTLPQGTVVRLVGVIDERFDRHRFLEMATGPVIVVDFDKVRRVTSFGVREWMAALAALQTRYLGFINARPSVIAQFNMVARFGEPGQLITFFAPYLCPGCETDTQVLVDLRRDYEAVKRFETPVVSCPKCRQAATFDDDPRTYFSYAASTQAPTPPPEIAGLLGEEAKVLRFDKLVEGNITGLWLSGELQRIGSFRQLIDSIEGRVVVNLENVSSSTPGGLEALRALWKVEGAECFVVKAPVPLLQHELDKLPPSARLLSVRGALDCPVGHSNAFDLDVAALQQLSDPGTPELSCSTCAQALPSAAFVDVLGRLPLAPTPADIAEFQRHHPHAPERASSSPHMTQLSKTPLPPGAGGPAFFGRYEILRRLGAGGMAEVFLARQHAMGGFEKQIVLKRILPGLAADASFRDMFLQEARLAARVSHPNVVQIFDVGQLDHTFFIIMEFVDGSDLNRLLRTAVRMRQPFPPHVAARIASDVCAGLWAAHSTVGAEGAPMPIIHRDVSPHNVLVSTLGNVKLSDFGIAKAFDSSDRTPSSTLKGKITYMAPEHAKPGDRVFDARSDIFPLGLILYEMLTLVHPFKRPTDYATMLAVLQEPVPDVRRQAPHAPEALAKVIARAMQRDPEKRYPTAQAMKQDLEQYLAGTHAPAGASEVAGFTNMLRADMLSASAIRKSVLSEGTAAELESTDDVTTKADS
ncbi:MAG: serine/threonine protein kinase [Archangiaceae bacterium]|nr:serine/threonine protein kinase [Archangiaceae bacterium]